MHNTTTIPIIRLMEVADRELIRLNFKASALYRHSKEFRNFLKYCGENLIENYCAETGSQYFKHLYGLNIGDPTVKLTKPQLDTRCSIRFLDDIFQFGYLGHNGLTGTQKYLQLTAQMYPDILTKLETKFGDLIPKVEVYNESL